MADVIASMSTILIGHDVKDVSEAERFRSGRPTRQRQNNTTKGNSKHTLPQCGNPHGRVSWRLLGSSKVEDVREAEKPRRSQRIRRKRES